MFFLKLLSVMKKGALSEKKGIRPYVGNCVDRPTKVANQLF